jgi:hypothetical protein
MPRVTDCDNASGLPIANTVSPTLSASESAKSTAGNSRPGAPLSWSTAMSESGSVPTRVASISSLLASTQTSRVARPAT